MERLEKIDDEITKLQEEQQEYDDSDEDSARNESIEDVNSHELGTE